MKLASIHITSPTSEFRRQSWPFLPALVIHCTKIALRPLEASHMAPERGVEHKKPDILPLSRLKNHLHTIHY